MSNSHSTPELRQNFGKLVDWNLVPKELIPKGYTRPRNSGNAELASMLEEDITNPYIFPLMADDLSQLPPAFILTIENDCLRDDGIIYAQRMKKAKSEVIHYNDKEGWHGMICFMDGLLSMDAAHKATDALINFIRLNSK